MKEEIGRKCVKRMCEALKELMADEIKEAVALAEKNG